MTDTDVLHPRGRETRQRVVQKEGETPNSPTPFPLRSDLDPEPSSLGEPSLSEFDLVHSPELGTLEPVGVGRTGPRVGQPVWVLPLRIPPLP